MQERLFVTKREAAAAISVSVRTLERLVADGLVPSVKVGRRRLFHLPSVLDALTAGSQGDQQKPRRRGRPRKPLAFEAERP